MDLPGTQMLPLAGCLAPKTTEDWQAAMALLMDTNQAHTELKDMEFCLEYCSCLYSGSNIIQHPVPNGNGPYTVTMKA